LTETESRPETTIFDVSRFRPMLLGLCLVGLGILCVGELARLVYSQFPPVQMVVDHMDPDRLAAQGSRIRAILEVIEREEDERPRAVLLGLSTMREDIDLPLVQQALPEMRWLNLGASGGSFVQLEYYSEALLHSPVDPRLAVLGLHVQWLSHPDARVRSQLAEHGTVAVLRPLDVFWAWRVRSTMGNLLRHREDSLRREVARRFSWDFNTLFPADRHLTFLDDGVPDRDDPFSATRKYKDMTAGEERLAFLTQHFVNYGWFDEDAYDASGSEAFHLKRLIKRLDEGGAKVVIVLMPEQEVLRSRIPRKALETMREVISRSGVDVALLDQRDWMAQKDFHDQAHLNAEGRPSYSQRLARSLLPHANVIR
jgi:hypothetical protein